MPGSTRVPSACTALQRVGVKPEQPQDRRRDLRGLDRAVVFGRVDDPRRVNDDRHVAGDSEDVSR
jgi:hypothetical protein